MTESQCKQENRILISAGGTGGHMFPAASLAQDLLSRGYEVALATDHRGRHFKAQFEGVPVHVLKAGTLQRGLRGKIAGLVNMGLGYVQGHKLLGRFQPGVVVGFGGYPSVPALLAAQHRKIPTIIHEQNAVIGRANAFLAPRADRIALSLPQVQGLDEADQVRAIVTGNPVRKDIAALYTQPYPTLKEDGTLRIFIIGGSLGASVFSRVIPKALTSLGADYRARLKIVQQCRNEDLAHVREIYESAGIDADLQPFFDNVADEFAACHLVIGRAGASTVAEVSTAGRPAIFVPYPHHADQQQKINAETVADTGGAWVMAEHGFTGEALANRIETFLQNPETLFRAAEAARTCGRPDAARKLGNLVTAIAAGWDKDKQKPFDLTQGRSP